MEEKSVAHEREKRYESVGEEKEGGGAEEREEEMEKEKEKQEREREWRGSANLLVMEIFVMRERKGGMLQWKIPSQERGREREIKRDFHNF